MTAVETVWVTAPDKAAAPVGGGEDGEVSAENRHGDVQISCFQGALHRGGFRGTINQNSNVDLKKNTFTAREYV